MPITTSDIKLRLSTTSGSAGNSTAQADPDASLGKYVSTTDIVDDTVGNLFDNVSGDENAASDVEYRCLFIYNSHATLTYESPKVWLSGRRCTATGSTDVISSTGHGFSDGDAVRVEAEFGTDALPSGLDNSTTYYVRDSASDSFKLASSEGGSAIDVGDSDGFATRQYGTTTVAIGIDTTAASAVGSSSAQALQVADESTAPAGVTFSSPATKSAGLTLGNLAPGECRAVWVRRTATDSSARNSDGCFLKVSGDTAD